MWTELKITLKGESTMTPNTDKDATKQKAKDDRRNINLLKFGSTIFGLLVVCGIASGQSKKESKKDDKEGVKTEVDVGFSNITGLKIEKDHATFYNDGVPSVYFGAEYKGFHADASASELCITTNGEWNFVNNKANGGAGFKFDNGIDISVRAGRGPFQPEALFSNVPKIDFWSDATGVAPFCAPSKTVCFDIEYNGQKISGGSISALNDGSLYMIPSKEAMDFFVKYSGKFEKDGHNLNVSVAGQFGEHHHKAYGTVNYKKDNIAVSATGNYDFDMKVLNANVRGAYKSLKSGMVYIIQGTVINEKYSVTLAAGKNGIQGFVAVENITPSQNKAPEFTSTPTISAGISYNWSVGRKL